MILGAKVTRVPGGHKLGQQFAIVDGPVIGFGAVGNGAELNVPEAGTEITNDGQGLLVGHCGVIAVEQDLDVWFADPVDQIGGLGEVVQKVARFGRGRHGFDQNPDPILPAAGGGIPHVGDEGGFRLWALSHSGQHVNPPPGDVGGVGEGLVNGALGVGLPARHRSQTEVALGQVAGDGVQRQERQSGLLQGQGHVKGVGDVGPVNLNGIESRSLCRSNGITQFEFLPEKSEVGRQFHPLRLPWARPTINSPARIAGTGTGGAFLGPSR